MLAIAMQTQDGKVEDVETETKFEEGTATWQRRLLTNGSRAVF